MRLHRWLGWTSVLGLVAGASSVVALSTGAGSVPADPPLSTYVCQGAQITLFDNTNGGLVANGGTPPTFSTNGRSYCVTYIQTYHWNDGHGATPGHLSLTRVSGPAGLPHKTHYWPAVGSAGQNGVANANFYADVSTNPPTIIDGTYQCEDTVRDSWSQDSQSGGAGFCIIYADPAVPPGTSPSTTTTTRAPAQKKSPSSVLRNVTILIVLAAFVGALLYYLFINNRPTTPGPIEPPKDPEGPGDGTTEDPNDGPIDEATDATITDQPDDAEPAAPNPPLSTEQGVSHPPPQDTIPDIPTPGQ